jgi:hypothetical protein
MKLKKQKMEIDITYGGLKLVDSGTIICSTNKDILITIDTIKMKIVFLTDKSTSDYKQEYDVVNGIRILKLTNYNRPQGIGFKAMWDLGSGYFFDYMVIGFPIEGTASRYLHYSIFKS